MQRDCGDVDFWNIVDAYRGIGGNRRHARRIIGEAAAIQHMIRGECGDFACRSIDADACAHLERMPLNSPLELLITILGEPHGATGKEHRRQRNVKREWRVVAPAKSAAHICEMRVDMRRLEVGAGVAQQSCDGGCGVVRRLHAEHEFEVFALGVIPGETAFGLEKHWINGLGLEFAVENEKIWSVGLKFGADLFAVACRIGVGGPCRHGEPRPYWAAPVLKEPWTDPAILDRRVHVGRVRRRTGDARESKRAVVALDDGAGFRAEFQERFIA